MKPVSTWSTCLSALRIVREIVSTMIFLAFVAALFLVVVIWWAWPSSPRVESGSTLVLDLSVPLVEGHDADTLPGFVRKVMGQESESLRLYDVLSNLQRAAEDPRIAQLAVVATSRGQLGMAQARELSAAVKLFSRQSGKPVLGYALEPDQKQLLVLSAADRVFLDPEGGVLLEGLSSFRPYFRSALVDKLGVDIHLFRVGEFKSAAEPFIRDNESREAKEASLFWMNDVWNRYLSDLSSYRGLEDKQVRALANHLPRDIAQSDGDLAQLALDSRLVDGLATDVEFHQELAKAGRWDEDQSGVVRTSMSSYIKTTRHSWSGQVAIIPIEGEIVDSSPQPGRAAANEVVERLRSVLSDPSIKAVVIRIDSPGGSVLGSELIRREVERVAKSGRPVVVSMGNVAASGGYWIATASDTVVADPSTITGSIGIFGLFPNFSRALDRWGVHTDGSSTAPMAGALDPTRPLDPRAADAIQQIIDHGYAKFLDRVSRARGMSVDEADDVARGRVWTGAQAKERNLVDREGGLMTAVLAAARQAQIDGTPSVIVMDGNYLGGAWGSSNQWSAIASVLRPSPYQALEAYGVNTPAWLEEAMKNKSGVRSKAYAHCLCSD